MDYQVTLTKLDNPNAKLSQGTSVTMFVDGSSDLMGELDSVSVLTRSLREIVKDGVDIQIKPARLVASYHWQVGE